MTIRLLAAEDLPVLLALYAHLHAHDDPAPPGLADRVWSEILADERIRHFGAFVGETLVAACHLVVVPNLTRACRPYGLIENVVTRADHRGRGFGKQVLQAALEHAWERGCYKVMLMTGRKDAATLHFYASAGFDAGEKQAFVAKPGA